MEDKNQIVVFQERKIRRFWDEEQEKWFFSVIDVIEALTASSIPRRYWSDLKRKLAAEGSQVHEEIVQLKFVAGDGKKYLSDAADTETINSRFRPMTSSLPEPPKPI